MQKIKITKEISDYSKKVLGALKKEGSIKSIVFGNGIFWAQQQSMPQVVNFATSKEYLNLTQSDKKHLQFILEKSKMPGEDLQSVVEKVVALIWVAKLDQSEVSDKLGLSNERKTATFKNVKKATKSQSNGLPKSNKMTKANNAPDVTVVIKKSKKIII